MTQEEYELYTGQAAGFKQSDWIAIREVASMRLALFLCLEELPGTQDEYADLGMLLANFICATLKFRGDYDAVESKSVRNFTIRFRTGSAANAFAQIAEQYGDVIDKYSACDLGVVVEKTKRTCCGRF